ncbi:hypothetical protein PM082_004025 [Marasmius tenuissimus]|nr:hypothetical protein PM082_004025 [Marasmius tenuissimus]
MTDSVPLPTTVGSLLLGALLSAFLSGTVCVQTYLYHKLYPRESWRLRSLVLGVWALDSIHTALIWSALWEYFVAEFGNFDYIGRIPRTLALSVAFTATLTFCVHCFLAHRIFKLSHSNWIITVPIAILALLRLLAAITSTVEMVILQSYDGFEKKIGWLFTLGLGLSSGVDVLITISLFYLLRRSRSESLGKLNDAIDSMIMYTFETGSVTAAATIASMICWIYIDQTALVFMGLHFIIGKLYASSLLVTLNTRKELRNRNWSIPSHVRRRSPTLEQTTPSRRRQTTGYKSDFTASELHINIERSVDTTTDWDIGLPRRYGRVLIGDSTRSKNIGLSLV